MANEITYLIENGEFMFRPNFAGRKTTFKEEGNREITVKIPEDQVDGLIKDGWNVKRGKDEEGNKGMGEAYLPIAIGFEFKAPRIMQVTSRGGTILDEELCGLLDSADINEFDCIVRAFDWSTPNGSGRKAYLKTFVGKIAEDYLEMKYADLFAGVSAQQYSENDEED